MTRQLLYVACPLAPSTEEVDSVPPFTISPGRGEYELDAKIWKPHETRAREALQANIQRALRWLAWLRKSFPETTFIAPWIASVMSGGDDSDPAQREAGMVDDCATIERCDGIVLCGGRISSGMRREMEHGISRAASSHDPFEFEVYDITWTGNSPNDIGPDMEPLTVQSFDRWHSAILHGRLR